MLDGFEILTGCKPGPYVPREPVITVRQSWRDLVDVPRSCATCTRTFFISHGPMQRTCSTECSKKYVREQNRRRDRASTRKRKVTP